MMPSHFEQVFGNSPIFNPDNPHRFTVPSPSEGVFPPTELASAILPAIASSDILHRPFTEGDVAPLLADESGAALPEEIVSAGLDVLTGGGVLARTELGYSATEKLKEVAPSIVEALSSSVVEEYEKGRNAPVRPRT